MSTILVVDDSAVCREPLAAILERRGHVVLRAEDGAVALELLKEHEPDVILLDVVMPNVDGLTVLRRLRSDPRHQGRPVILVSGVTERSAVLEARALGVQGYLLKTSFSVDQLLERINACLEGRCAPAPGTDAA